MRRCRTCSGTGSRRAPELHQEHLEPGRRYDEVALTTRRLLARPRATVAALAADCTARVLDERPIAGMRLVRLRDLVMPIWAEFSYELVFGERCPRRARELIVGNANDVVTALKCTGLRHMGRRHRLTRYLVDRLEHGSPPLQPLPAGLSTRERALYLQGAFFNTAVVQMSEATAHLLMVLAQHPEAQARVAAEPEDAGHFDRVLDETMRLYPLFGIAHRITSADIAVDGHTIPPGSVLCFNYPAYHRTGYDDPDAFRPERWEDLSHRDAAFIPFGVAGNRPCPARGIAPVAIQAAAREVLRRFALASSASHTRSIPNRGPCVLVSRTTGGRAAPAAPAPAARVRAGARPLGGRLAQPRPARARDLHGVGRPPAPHVRAPFRGCGRGGQIPSRSASRSSSRSTHCMISLETSGPAQRTRTIPSRRGHRRGRRP